MKKYLLVAFLVSLFSCSILYGLDISGFGDVSYKADLSGADNSAFAFGQYDLFFKHKINKNILFVNETVFEVNDENTAVLDIERLYISFSVNELLSLSLGRYHTALGYWNTAAHHGALLYPTISRPYQYNFEDEGGILPVHITGIEATGENDKFGYIANLGNGRGVNPDNILQVNDNNQNKAVNLLVYAKELIPGLRVGGGVYYDTISTNPNDNIYAVATENITETIIGGHVVYMNGPIQLLAELSNVLHNGESSGAFTTTAYYLTAGYQLGNITPYAMYQSINYDAGGDNFFSTNADTTIVAGGIKYDIDVFTALKLEVSRTTVGGISGTIAKSQISFAF